ncbi:Uncharacterised protein [Legionella busanensis]|uniref:Transmembrane protein n=1 Tax=Legionella busanensis TaxID=190655 RepID=A0A378JQB9_9GAMM|nr:hypothetical protein [Legionella busanensis]STX52369.1 Uncharacterised protein [Legionella busanensis]
MTTTIKSALEGIGSGNGAWPIFGILSAVFNLAIGGTTAFILGSICSSAFLLISIPIAYKSYQNMKKQQQELEEKKERYENLLLANLNALLITMQQFKILNTDNAFTSLLEEKVIDLEQLDKDKNKLFSRFLQYLSFSTIFSAYNQLEPQLFAQLLRKHINQFLINESNIKSYSSEENKKINEATFQSFMGTFGTIAGGSAGLVGMLVGLGLMAGLSVMPWVGITVLIIATVAAIYMADMTARNTKLNISKADWCKQIKNLSNVTYRLNCELQKLNKPSQIIESESQASKDLNPNTTIINESKHKIDTQATSAKEPINVFNRSKRQPTVNQSTTKASSYSTYPHTMFSRDNNVKKGDAEIEFLTQENFLQQF